MGHCARFLMKRCACINAKILTTVRGICKGTCASSVYVCASVSNEPFTRNLVLVHTTSHGSTV